MPKHAHHYFLVFLVSLVLTFFMYRFGILEKVEHISYDWRVQALSSKKPVSDDIALVLVDQSSLEWMQSEQGIGWPWPRELYGAFTSFAKQGGAKAVVFDMIFSEDSVYNKTDDIAFEEALKVLPSFGAVVLGNSKYGRENWPKHLAHPALKECRGSKESKGAVFPIIGLDTSFSALGAVNASPDSDGVIRRARLCYTFDNLPLPSLPFAIYNYLYPKKKQSFKSEVFINYHKAPFSYKAYSAASIIQSWSALQDGNEPTLRPDIFKDKVVFIGISASGLFDQRVSPLSKNHPGVDIQARVFDNLVSDSFIEPVKNVYELFYMLVFGVLTTFIMMRSSKWTHFIIPTIVFPSFIFALGYLYYYYNCWLDITLLLSDVLLIIVLSAILGYMLEGRQKRYLKNAFSHYVSPAIVNKLLESPEQLKLGGESRELSIFFSDIQGFTSVSEKLKPELLIEMLHKYLDALSTIIMEHQGTIDKYEGDAIIAFWNAPLDTKEHETLAVKAALACEQKLSEINPVFKELYGVELKTRIGIHTGRVTVGNLGSQKHFDYSFIGDAGNLASRLEGVNKVFGSDILVSKTTYEKVKGIDFRKIGTIKVVGRDEPVEVYQPLRTKPENQKMFRKALELFESEKFDESRKIFEDISASDTVAKNYLKIIKEIEDKTISWDKAIILLNK